MKLVDSWIKTWYNICVVSNVGTSSFYINSSVDPNWFTGSTGYNANRMGDDPGSETFKGKIAAVRVYNRVLTSDEILQNYTMMRGRFNLR